MAKKKKNRSSEQGTSTAPLEILDRIELSGKVVDALPGTLFKVEVDGGGIVLATLAGKLRMNKIRVLVEDSVVVEVSPYDTSRGRIVLRR